LGGNPLRDVVLARAMLARDKPAQVLFDVEYRDAAVRIGGNVDPRWRDDTGWWDALVERLIGTREKPGKLERFAGRCSLKFWLGTVVRRFLYDLPKTYTLDVERDVPSPVEADSVGDVMTRECFEVLTARIRRAIEKLEPAQVLVLAMSLVDNLPGKEIAQVLSIAEGNVSRRRQKALDQLLAELADPQGGRGDSDGVYQTCLGHILATPDRAAFAQAIARSLADARGAEVA
jgi:RNA polymerase sigma factor (sigma-70 family)